LLLSPDWSEVPDSAPLLAALGASELALVALDRDLAVRGWSSGAEAVFGWSAGETIGRPWAEIGLVGDPVRTRQFEADSARVLDGLAWSGERIFRRADGSPAAVRATSQPILGTDGSVVGVLFLAFDVTAREDFERALVREALHDPLTGLPNRTLIQERLTKVVSGAGPVGLTAVVFVDLDGFKAVNDAYGHATGDAVLRTVAQRLRRTVRDTDMVGRLGGDEFVVVCRLPEGSDAADALRGRIVRAVAAPINVSGHLIEISASVGLARVTQGANAEVLLDLADADMYRAKADSRIGSAGVN
jgi:diguanylate cyclase (GGDEF)-like protein/PAS domain S-box-containing protein